jgi:hypothetical protein
MVLINIIQHDCRSGSPYIFLNGPNCPAPSQENRFTPLHIPFLLYNYIYESPEIIKNRFKEVISMLKRSLSWYLISALFIISIVPRAEGAFIPSEAMAFNDAQRDTDLGRVRTFLETKIVSQRLRDLGFSSEEVKERLSLLSDRQLHNYAQHLDTLRVGGNGLEAVIGVLVIIILILVILHLTGHKVIIK